MKIIKYKKGSKGLYKVELDDGRVLSLYEDVILKFDLLLKKEIMDSDLDSINKYNLECDVYYVALNNIKSRFKSEFELRNILKKKEYPDEYIELAINKLIKQGYLNDRLFARSYINNQMITTSRGPLRIQRDLLDKKIDYNVINEELGVFSEEEQMMKIKKIISKKLQSNHSRGGYVLKQKVVNDVKLLGYDSLVISRVISEFDFSSNDEDIAKKEYNKLYKRLSHRYSGDELERKIREKLYQKGLKLK